MAKKLHRDEDGTLPAYAWPGGYPIVYMCADIACLCPDCANQKNGSEACEGHDDKQWRLVDCFIHWEGAAIQCDHCNAGIESAYGDPDSEEKE